MISKTRTLKTGLSEELVSSKNLPVLLEEIQELTLPILNEAFKSALDKADTSFFQRAEKAKSDNEQNLYFDAMRELRLGRDDAEQSFDKGLRDCFNRFPLERTGESLSDEKHSEIELSLVKEDDLEEDIALETMVSKTTSDNQEAIEHLSIRLDALVADTHVDETNNPLSPLVISEVLALAAAGVELSIRCKIILYKQFDLSVMSCLKEALQLSNKVLIDAGVLPDLRYKGTKSPEGDSERAEQLTEALVSNLTELAELDASAPGPQFGQLQGLLSQARINGFAPPRFGVSNTGGPLQGPQGSGPQSMGAQQGQDASAPYIITPTELFGVLNSVQTQIETTGGYTLSLAALQNNNLSVMPPSAVRQSIAEELAKNSEQGLKNLEEENEDVINLVEMLFEIILDDDYLPDTIQALISRLQIPIIKVALKDRDFFNLPRHPARKLLNELARASVGWVAGRTGSNDQFLERMFDVVHTICDAKNIDVQLFEEQYLEFIKKSEKERKRAKLSERRTKEYEVGVSRAKFAKECINQLLSDLCVEKDVPKAVNDLLFQAWHKVLYFTYINEGQGSKKWTEQLQVAEDLIWSVQPLTDARSQIKRAKLLPGLLQNLHEQLTEISYDPFHAQALFSQLECAHIAAFRAGVAEQIEKQQFIGGEQASQENIEDDIEIFVKQAKHRAGPVHKSSVPVVKVVDKEIESMLKNLESPEILPSLDASGLDDSVVDSNKLNRNESDSKASANEEAENANKPLTAIQRQKVRQDQQDFENIEIVESLKVDTWFVFVTVDGSECRCKLIEKIAQTNELVFVNRRGQRELVKSYAEMASDLSSGSVRIIDSASLIDRAFGSLLSKLKDNNTD